MDTACIYEVPEKKEGGRQFVAITVEFEDIAGGVILERLSVGGLDALLTYGGTPLTGLAKAVRKLRDTPDHKWVTLVDNKFTGAKD